jgi:predicted Zn-dependent protease
MASRSERPQLTWTFRVVDDPVVNAFALPGGYIYVTRGILAHFNSEAEMASVLGHEIGHVTARHSVNQMSKAQLASLGLGIGSILAPEFGQFGQLAQTGLSLLFLKYGRDDERQADELGLRYTLASGYDPRPMVEMFQTLARISGTEEGGRVPSWLATHPQPDKREADTQARIEALADGHTGMRVNREGYLQAIDGIVFGEDPRQGFFEGHVFYHPQLAFKVVLPQGWKTANTRQAVVGMSGNQDAAIQIRLSRESTANAALRAFASQQGITPTGAWTRRIQGLPSAGSGFSASDGTNSLAGVVVYVEHQQRVFELLGYALQSRWGSYENAIAGSISSFERVTDRRVLEVEPGRVEIVRPSATMSLSAFAQRYESSVPVETLALINHLEAGAQLEGGKPYKVVRGGPTS